jgi:hypothetical protein
LSGLFREEAIRRYLDRGGRGEIARLTPGWMGATFWLVVGAALAGACFLVFAHVDELASGPAVISGSHVEAFLPGAYARRLTPGQLMTVRLEGYPRSFLFAIEAVEPRILSPEEARARLGVASGDGVVEGARIVVRATAPSLTDGQRGRADVAVATRRLGEALFR